MEHKYFANTINEIFNNSREKASYQRAVVIRGWHMLRQSSYFKHIKRMNYVCEDYLDQKYFSDYMFMFPVSGLNSVKKNDSINIYFMIQKSELNQDPFMHPDDPIEIEKTGNVFSIMRFDQYRIRITGWKLFQYQLIKDKKTTVGLLDLMPEY